MDKSNLLKQAKDNELMRFLGVHVDLVSPDRVVLTMEVTPKIHQYVGIMQGGVSLFLCEAAASIGAVAAADLTRFTPTAIEINASHVRSVSRGMITVDARPLYPGRTMTVWNIEITNKMGKLICTSRCTLLLQKRAAQIPE